ncbi:SusD/RagB family nutrient-binding outer membrane lipoprotein [Chryseobacterium mucoviscidosis]|uniref:SusD/RagB family nutrient-binding outer membrane lipoprotein n=1 Tax=Chryseobacterium mucoviscidosis TaxID=1945581 RepID=A0A202C7V3_9FLAO|nr:SusD/RagB family nutrient-binding outer membrane lipoprotein [Chryseobacterium mucoviscidosis]OVE59879.1 hypothetical protein B0E34_04595 [Chryseobacterium mucoviscidosis]
MKKIFLIIGSALLMLTSCEDIESLNVDPKAPVDNPPSGYLFSSGVVTGLNQMNTLNVNRSIFRHLTQQLADVTYREGTRYSFRRRDVADAHWNQLFYALNSLNKSKEIIATETLDAKVKANRLAMIDAMQVYFFQILVDSYGNVPYSQALQIEQFLSPKYDDGKTIYQDLIKRINADISALDNSAAGFGSDDVVYGGDLVKWRKFMNSLKLKLGMNLADVDASLAKSTVESAYSAGVFSSNTDSAIIQYQSTGLFTSPLYEDLVLSGRVDFCATNLIVNYLKTNNDPRISKYFTTALSGSNAGQYVGGTFGLNPSAAQTLSLINPSISVANGLGYLADYVEIEFLLAEAAARGYSVGSIATHFDAGIGASMDHWKVSATDKAAYLATHNYAVQSTTGNPWKKIIGDEAWIAMYNRGFEAWTFNRRLDNRTYTPTPPVRVLYPIKEYSINSSNVAAASTAIGGDEQTTKIFWDVN